MQYFLPIFPARALFTICVVLSIGLLGGRSRYDMFSQVGATEKGRQPRQQHLALPCGGRPQARTGTESNQTPADAKEQRPYDQASVNCGRQSIRWAVRSGATIPIGQCADWDCGPQYGEQGRIIFAQMTREKRLKVQEAGDFLGLGHAGNAESQGKQDAADGRAIGLLCIQYGIRRVVGLVLEMTPSHQAPGSSDN
jgi:hypothetical protein